MHERLLLNEMCVSSGVEVVQASHKELGLKQELMLIVKIPVQSGGVVTVVNQMLSSMNFEVTSESVTCCDGSTVIQSLWKLKGVRCRLSPQIFGLPLTWTHARGTLN